MAGVERLVHVGSISGLYLGDAATVVTGATPPDARPHTRNDYSHAKTLADAPAWTTPSLLLYAGTDRLVDPQGSARFAAQAPATARTDFGAPMRCAPKPPVALPTSAPPARAERACPPSWKSASPNG